MKIFALAAAAVGVGTAVTVVLIRRARRLSIEPTR